MAVPLVSTKELGEYTIEDGIISLTWRVKFPVSVPPELVAVTM
jgi:hypothetical protein